MAKPSIGESNWGTTLNDHLDGLAVDIAAKADASALAAKQNSASLAADMAAEVADDSSPVAAAMSAKFAKVFRPEAYGATGDGATDDTAAFLAAINAASAAGGRVYAANRYSVALSLTDQNIDIFGPGTLVHRQAATALAVKRTLGASKGVSSIGTVRIGAANGTNTGTNTKIALSGSLAGITQGDLFLLSSQDQYPWAGQLGTIVGSTTQVWQTGFVPVLGIGVTVNVTGTITEGNTLTGQTSGATGRVQAVAATDSAGVSTVILASVTGSFTVGENLSVGGITQGTASDAGFIIMAGQLVDTYSTSPVLRLVPKTKFAFELDIEASGDVDSIVGAANRLPAVTLRGVYRPKVVSRVRSAWTRAWQVSTCYDGTFEVDIDKLPNNADPSESAYGYGVEFTGATERCTAIVRGGNCRHAFTTNVTWGGFAFVDVLDTGNPKNNVVRDSHVSGAISASFDTHWGAYDTHFINCVSVASGYSGRTLSGSVGFQNRGFGTTYTNCRDRGSVIGFVEDSATMDAGFQHRVRWINCVAENYQKYGFAREVSAVNNNAHFYYKSCEAVGDGLAVNAPHFQVGFITRGGGVDVYDDCVSRRFNGSPFRITAGSGRHDLNNFFIDAFDCPSSVSGIRFDAAPNEVNVRGLKVRTHPSNATTPVSALRVAGGAVTVNMDGYSVIGHSTTIPLAAISAGSLAVNWKGQTSVAPVAYVGDASATVTPRVDAPTQVFNTPLTANRTLTLSTGTGPSINGDRFRVVRTAAATGAFTLTVAGKTLAAGQYAEATYDGTAWVLTAFGSL